jgi:peptidoglycan/LPS O-acetylase OafA/YrhL
MRGIAVLLVVLFHCGTPGFAGGFTGVDVFFALSGYLITGLIVDEVEQTGKLSFSNFYARRVRRLLPASGLLVVATLLLGLLIYSPLEMATYAKYGYYTSLYISNWMFMHDAANYFASDIALNPFLHTWSLAVEEQFYLFWPALIVLALSRTRSRTRSRNKLVASLLALCLLSFTLCIWLTHRRLPWAFFSLTARAWEFGMGGLACLLPKNLFSKTTQGIKSIGWTGLAAVLAAGYFYSAETKFPGYAALLPVAGTIAVLIAGTSRTPSALQSVLANRVLQYLGRLSYSWYLWHWPVLLFSAVLFPHITWLGKLLPAVIALLLAQLTFTLLEKPVRLSRFLVARPALSLSLALFIPLIGITGVHFILRQTYRSLASPAQSRFWAASQDPRILFDANCLSLAGGESVKECVYGDRESATVAVLFGDSHAEHWFSALQQIAGDKHWRLVTLLKASCPAARVTNYSAAMKRIDTECSSWRESALQRIAELHPYIVVVSETNEGVTTDVAEDAQPARKARISPQQWQDGLHATLAFLDSRGIATLLLADIPRAQFDVPVCLSRAAAHSWSMQKCFLPRNTSLNESADQAEAAAASGFHTVRRADFTNKFCAGSICQSVINGEVVYRDSNHMTSTFAQSLAPSLQREIDSATGGR